MVTESTLQAYIMKRCKEESILCMKFASPSRRGVPDLILLYKGFTCFVEVKSPNKTGQLTRHQKHYIEIINQQGVPCFVADSKNKANWIIDDVLANGGAK